ncbi:MAG: Gfo/Idh/MocA family oxidoreductase [Patescibacteria group bacterium]
MSTHKRESRENTVSVGLIGIGPWGMKLASRFDAQANLRGFTAKGNAERVEIFKKEFPSVTHYSSTEALLEDTSIQAVVIATPIETHFEMARLALNHGKHVFVEKPAALDQTSVRELIGLAQKHNRVLFTGYTFLYHPVYKHLRELIKDTPPQRIIFSWQKLGSFRESGILNLICHDVALFADLVGELRGSHIFFRADIIGKDDIAQIGSSFGTAGSALFTINRVFPGIPTKSVVVMTDSETYVWENDALYKASDGSLHDITEKVIASQPLEQECSHFLERVAEDTYWSRSDGVHDMEVARFFEEVMPPSA